MKTKIIILIGVIVSVTVAGVAYLNRLRPAGSPEPQSKLEAGSIHSKLYDLADLYKGFKLDCPDLFQCYNSQLKDLDQQYGPKAALEILRKLQSENRLSGVDDHQLAHEVGRKTAQVYGMNMQSFLLCPTWFNYGCQHGFFEHALGNTNSTKEAADLVCGSLDESFSSKFQFYCYHGVGHGIMMAQAYDLYASLRECDALLPGQAQDGCWQGVFMENVNAVMRGEARLGIFSTADPLAPCNSIADKYRHECFINIAGWLMMVFTNDIEQASRVCLAAPTDNISACAQSIGLMVSNPTWQGSLGGSRGSREEIAWNLCDKFPQEIRGQCVIGAVDNILNFDELETSGADSFCGFVAIQYRESCYRTIGQALRNQVVEVLPVKEHCDRFDVKSRVWCYAGAGL